MSEWWRQNPFGFDEDKWSWMVKAYSLGNYVMVAAFAIDQLDNWEAILSELAICDWGRYGHTREEAEKEPKSRKW
jgi:hypothetical protein